MKSISGNTIEEFIQGKLELIQFIILNSIELPGTAKNNA